MTFALHRLGSASVSAPQAPPRDPAAIFLPGGHSERRRPRPTAQARPRAQAHGLGPRAAVEPGAVFPGGSWVF